MASVSGKLETILESGIELGSVVIALCGYGPRLPRVPGHSALARVTTLELDAASDGTFTADVPGNDTIQPPGTYYTITVKDSNGDVVQTNAYIFLGDDTYHLEDTPPFDPSLPMMPLPPLIINELLIVPASDTMNFDGSTHTALKTTLHNHVRHPTYSGMVPGNLYTFIIAQDASGGWEFAWGDQVHNGTMVKLDPNAFTIQTFVADYNGNLYAISAGVYQP